eukprot:gene3266-13290_t
MDKLKNWFKPTPEFKGSGRKLGTAEDQPKPPPRAPPEPKPEPPAGPQRQLGIDANLQNRQQQTQKSARKADASSSSTMPQQQQHGPPSPTPAGHMPHGVHVPTDQVQRLALDQVVTVNTPTGREAQYISQQAPPVHASSSSVSAVPSVPSQEQMSPLDTPTAGESKSGLPAAGIEEDYKLQQCIALVSSQATANDSLLTMNKERKDYKLQQCIALVSSQPTANDSLLTMYKICSNIMSNPTEPKYRQIRLSNPKVQEQLVNVNGAVEFLEEVGFQFRFDEGTTTDGNVEGFAVLPEEASLSSLNIG